MNANNTKNPLSTKSSTVVIVLLVIGGILALVSWLIFGNIYQLGIYIAIFVGVITWSFLMGSFARRQQRKFLWLACIIVLLGSTVVALKYFNLMGYILSKIYALFALLFVMVGMFVQEKKKQSANED